MNIIEKNIRDLIPYDKNPRNNDGAVEAVAASIKEFGWKVPKVGGIHRTKSRTLHRINGQNKTKKDKARQKGL